MTQMIDGVAVKMGNMQYTVPPMNFKLLKKLNPQMTQITAVVGTPTEAQTEAIIDVVHGCLLRNYPEITRDEIEENLDLGNTQSVIKAIMGVSGLVASGEAKAGS